MPALNVLCRLISGKCLIFDVFRFQHLAESVTKQKTVFAVVKPEAHFVKVGLQMLCANTMLRSKGREWAFAYGRVLTQVLNGRRQESNRRSLVGLKASSG